MYQKKQHQAGGGVSATLTLTSELEHVAVRESQLTLELEDAVERVRSAALAHPHYGSAAEGGMVQELGTLHKAILTEQSRRKAAAAAAGAGGGMKGANIKRKGVASGQHGGRGGAPIGRLTD
jgi:hypothetical protein